MIVDYNSGKMSIDLSDQFSSYGSCLRKTVKWYRKVAVEVILGTAIVNAHFLNKLTTGNSMSIIQFRESIVKQLLGPQEILDEEFEAEGVRNKRIRKHAFKRIPGSSRIGRKYCRGCYEKKSKGQIPKSRVRKICHI